MNKKTGNKKMTDLVFKLASTSDEIEQIRALNYRTFVEEIPQHRPNPDRSLADRFEKENLYVICLRGGEVIAMIAMRSARPFSLDAKLDGLDNHLPPHMSACEVRLLSIAPDHRRGRIFTELIKKVFELFEIRGHDLALISGTLRQANLYEHMGFQPFGPIVGSAEASYQPMYQFVNDYRERTGRQQSRTWNEMIRPDMNLLPGPVDLSPGIQSALRARPISHRSDLFVQFLERTRQMLCGMTGSETATLAVGSGTLANDLIAGQLAQLPGQGLMLVNGEFGQRLIDHARRWGLSYDVLEIPWGTAFDESAIREALGPDKSHTWLWAVHAETSTGVLNPMHLLKGIAREKELTLCLDCISSLGVVPCELEGVTFASGVSGKGLRCMSGLAFVFHAHTLPARTRTLPRYIDLQLYQGAGTPFTMPSALLTALTLSLETLDIERRTAEIQKASLWMCQELEKVGLSPLALEADRFPGVINLPLRPGISSRAVGDALAEKGWLLSYQSCYLIEQNWIQICLFGQTDFEHLRPLPGLLADEIKALS